MAAAPWLRRLGARRRSRVMKDTEAMELLAVCLVLKHAIGCGALALAGARPRSPLGARLVVGSAWASGERGERGGRPVPWAGSAAGPVRRARRMRPAGSPARRTAGPAEPDPPAGRPDRVEEPARRSRRFPPPDAEIFSALRRRIDSGAGPRNEGLGGATGPRTQGFFGSWAGPGRAGPALPGRVMCRLRAGSGSDARARANTHARAPARAGNQAARCDDGGRAGVDSRSFICRFSIASRVRILSWSGTLRGWRQGRRKGPRGGASGPCPKPVRPGPTAVGKPQRPLLSILRLDGGFTGPRGARSTP